MKNNELDLDILENSDNSLINELTEKYPPVSENDIDRLYEKSEKIYHEKSAEAPMESVSGVETYHRPIWSKIGTFAAVIALIAGIGAGGMLLFRNKPSASQSVSEDISETALASAIAPFGDIHDSRIRLLTNAYTPFLLEISAEDTAELAGLFNFWVSEEADSNAPYPDGERIIAYIDTDGSHFRLIFYGDNTMDCEKDECTVRYKLTEEIAETVHKLAHPTEQETITEHLIPCKFENITVDGVWENNEPIPEYIFEEPEIPDKLKDREMTEYEPLYEYAWDMENIYENAANAANIIVGRVDSISYEPRCGVAYTQINITVTDDALDIVQAGENVCIETVGGYISGFEKTAEINRMSGTDLADDGTYYHEIVGSGEVPIIGKEYAFFVNSGCDASNYGIVGLEFGMLYKCDNLYIQRNSQGFNYFDFEELKAMLG